MLVHGEDGKERSSVWLFVEQIELNLENEISEWTASWLLAVGTEEDFMWIQIEIPLISF